MNRTIFILVSLVFLVACSRDIPSYFDSLETPKPLTEQLLAQDQESVTDTFKSIQNWTRTILRGGKPTLEMDWYTIDEKAYMAMITELEKHYSTEVAMQIVERFFRKDGDHYTLIEQESLGRLNILENVEFSIEKGSDVVLIVFTGSTDEGEIEEEFVLQMDDLKVRYEIVEYNFLMK